MAKMKKNDNTNVSKDVKQPERYNRDGRNVQW